ncbi:general transcription factor IIF subunit 1-like [Tigriopus californicus]|nr:general transcription factor IIF subunit 1-like [Tigriopus californicus]
MAEQVQEFNIRMPTKNKRKKYQILKFNASLKIDPAKWTQLRMVRENNKKEYRGFGEEMPKEGAGSEFGREQREEARRKKYGINAKKYNPDDQPWLMRIGSKKEGKQYKGLREGGVSENAAYYVFTHSQDGSFEAHPVHEWYNFTPRVTYKTLNAEEAEEKFAERGKILNHFAVMVNRKLRPGQTEADEDIEDEGGKKGKKGAAGKKDLKISDMDDWVDSDGALDSDSEKEKEKSDDEDGNKKKARSKDSKKKNKKKEEADSEGFEDSDDGDGEGREVDYMSDESSASEEELQEQANTKGVDQDEGLSKMLDSDESDTDDENKDKDKDKEENEDENGEKPKKKKKKKAAKDGDGSNGEGDSDDEKTKKGKGSKGNSRSTTPAPDPDSKESEGKNSRADKRKALVDSMLDPRGDTSKKSRMDTFGSSQSSLGNVDASIEEDVRRYLARKQMTTTELLKKFKTKKTGLSKEELMQQLVEALRKINPQKKKVKGVMYLFLKS